jgi:hypothetical protein
MGNHSSCLIGVAATRRWRPHSRDRVARFRTAAGRNRDTTPVRPALPSNRRAVSSRLVDDAVPGVQLGLPVVLADPADPAGYQRNLEVLGSARPMCYTPTRPPSRPETAPPGSTRQLSPWLVSIQGGAAEAERLHSALGAGAGVDVLEVLADGGLGDCQTAGDLAVGEAVAD